MLGCIKQVMITATASSRSPQHTPTLYFSYIQSRIIQFSEVTVMQAICKTCIRTEMQSRVCRPAFEAASFSSGFLTSGRCIVLIISDVIGCIWVCVRVIEEVHRNSVHNLLLICLTFHTEYLCFIAIIAKCSVNIRDKSFSR